MTSPPISITVTSSLAPVRVATPFANQRYQVLTLSVTDTVWLSTDPGLASGVGTPLYPGRSLVRTDPQFYVILDAAATGPVTIVIDPSVDEWQGNPIAEALAILSSGMIIVDTPATLIQGSVAASTFYPSVTTLFNVNKYQSLIINYTIGGTAHTVDMAISWFADAAGAILIGGDDFKWANTDLAFMRGTTIPIRGPYMRVAMNLGGGAPSDGISFVASNRVRGPISTTMGTGVGSRVLASFTGNIGAGASQSLVPLIRYDGPVIVAAYGLGLAANSSADIQLVDLTNSNIPAGAGVIQQLAVVIPTPSLNFACVAPRNSWAVNINNRDTAIRSFACSVIAAPEGT